MKKNGRPSGITIKKERLLELRKEAGLTQEAMGEFVARSKFSTAQTRSRSYQRIEREGLTSKTTVENLAKGLAEKLHRDASKLLDLLCGGQPEPPPDRIDEIEKQLRKQLDGGDHALLQRALEPHKDADNPIRELAENISSRLEVAQLEQREDALEQLAALMGWTAEELKHPTSQQGYWLLITNTCGHRETQILLGVTEVLHQVKTAGGKWLHKLNEIDARVELSESAPWLRVLLQHSRRPRDFQEFSFVRCAPSATGLQWVKPTEWDRWWLNELRIWAFQHANFVKGFKAEDVWPLDLGCLRLQVQQRVKPESPNTAEDNDWWKNIAVHKGWLGEEEAFQDTRERFRADGQEHALVTNRLASGLWDEVLLPLLSPIPADWWCIEAWGLGVRISTKNFLSIREMSRYALEPEGRTYFIQLVEETEAGDLRAAPWRQRCVEALVKRLQEDLERYKAQASIGPKNPPDR